MSLCCKWLPTIYRGYFACVNRISFPNQKFNIVFTWFIYCFPPNTATCQHTEFYPFLIWSFWYGEQKGKCIVVYHGPTCQRNQPNFLQVTDPCVKENTIYNTKFNIIRMVKKICNLVLSTLLSTENEFYRLPIQLCNSRRWLEIFIYHMKLQFLYLIKK